MIRPLFMRLLCLRPKLCLLLFALIFYHLDFRKSAAFGVPLLFCCLRRHGKVQSDVEKEASKLPHSCGPTIRQVPR